MEDQEALETRTLVSQFTDTIQDQVNDLLADRVMATSVVVGGIFLASDQLFWMEQLAVCTRTYLIWKQSENNNAYINNNNNNNNNFLLYCISLNQCCFEYFPLE